VISVALPLQDLLKSIGVNVQFHGYFTTAYCQDLKTKEKFICLSPDCPNLMRMFCYFHELGHAIDHYLLKDNSYHEMSPEIFQYVFGSSNAIQSRHIRTEVEMVANRVASKLCAKYGIKTNRQDKNYAKRKAPKRAIKRVNAIMEFIESNS
jgi:hypothetical protein